MKRADAHHILDAARAGLPISEESITEALLVTGDLQPIVEVARIPRSIYDGMLASQAAAA